MRSEGRAETTDQGRTPASESVRSQNHTCAGEVKVDVKLSVDVDGGTEGANGGGQGANGGGEVMSIFNIFCKEKKTEKEFLKIKGRCVD